MQCCRSSSRHAVCRSISLRLFACRRRVCPGHIRLYGICRVARIGNRKVSWNPEAAQDRTYCAHKPCHARLYNRTRSDCHEFVARNSGRLYIKLQFIDIIKNNTYRIIQGVHKISLQL